MEVTRIRLMILGVSFSILFSSILAPINLLAFAQIQPPSPQQPVIPKSVPAQESIITSVQEFPGVLANGSIGYSIYVTKEPKYVAEGKWNIVDDGSNADFSANMTWWPNDLSNSSITKYQIRDFQPDGQHITVQPNNITLQGIANVSANGMIKWSSIPVSIKITGYVLDISFTGNDQNSVTARNHFGNQDVLGVVKALRACPNQPLSLIPVTC